MNPFLGSWIGPDEYTAEVEYTVRMDNGKVAVSAVDPGDGETADVFDVIQTPGNLHFTARWPSTGRTCLCVFRLIGDDEVELTFTYTDRAMLVRKQA